MVTEEPRGWGKVLIGTRLEKQVSARFLQVWESIVTRGLRQGDACFSVRGLVAHKASNRLVQVLLASECDSLLFLDSDAVVEHDIIRQFAEYEPGYEYDILQAFYCRRGWPPAPIWMRKTPLGQTAEYYVTDPDVLGDVSVGGTHCLMVRREVFEEMRENGCRETGVDPAAWEWFFYPRHKADSEDGAFSEEALAAGFRIGATTAIRAGHLCELETHWGSYMDYLQYSGKLRLFERHSALGKLIGEFVGEDPELVQAKAMMGREFTAAAWQREAPGTGEETRAFYGQRDNGYLYDLLWWNTQPEYERIIEPLYGVRNSRALVVGPGLGTECEALLAGGNEVDAYELPGVLHEFMEFRFNGHVRLIGGVSCDGYDVVSAVDVIEHVHPDEVEMFLGNVRHALKPGGLLVCHVAGQAEEQPMHYDHRDVVLPWLAEGFEQVSDSSWRRVG